ncbi:MAG: hypothetical protein U9P14_00260 [Gemmatimonadota bacterium]|nr:hypothetical protein [Gemmatimonadota bacterium]
MKRFQVMVFGKQGCDKCKVLKSRLEKILAEESYIDFELVYNDLGTVEGLVRFCQSERLNPQRIPGFMIFEHQGSEESGVCRPLCHLQEMTDLDGEPIEIFLGLETDYTGDGTLRPKAIRQVLDEALTTHQQAEVRA